ncbi:hypothetical protein T265_05403 [Opisthorchis viverrini]|uniref:Uncharacterized protein n=1 Tax=Opisthorchis viverrini TaxID=6198 RepID=A0A074ZP49_OPIVI|nr:hypothetical protein T265_05403 [Opisthorchis viverrini]KER27587.1 hypothetical protein T265_05403 [Opisthorchis viverrini]
MDHHKESVGIREIQRESKLTELSRKHSMTSQIKSWKVPLHMDGRKHATSGPTSREDECGDAYIFFDVAGFSLYFYCRKVGEHWGSFLSQENLCQIASLSSKTDVKKCDQEKLGHSASKRRSFSKPDELRLSCQE